MANLGLPGTSSFVGEFLLLVSAFEANTTSFWLIIILFFLPTSCSNAMNSRQACRPCRGPYSPIPGRGSFGDLPGDEIVVSPPSSIVEPLLNISAYSRDSSKFSLRRSFNFFKRRTSSGQSRLYRFTQLGTDGVHCRESTGTGPVALQVVRQYSP